MASPALSAEASARLAAGAIPAAPAAALAGLASAVAPPSSGSSAGAPPASQAAGATAASAGPSAGPKAAAPTASLAETARAKYSTGGVRFIKAELLGTVPCNRSGLGVSGYHVHEVVASIRADGLSRRRYRDASVVKVPEAHLEAFREFNRTMCEGDELLPAFAPGMRYALLTKNHFAHAVKLFDAASAMLHGTKEAIKPNPLDKQLEQHLTEGIACEVLREELWDEDPQGLRAIVGEDNLDAATDLAASEMEVLRLLRKAIDETKDEKDASVRFRRVLAKAQQVFGNVAYSEQDMANLYNFAVRVPSGLVDNLCTVHFAVVPAALLRVRPVDFASAAKLDSAHPYIKVALIISMHVGAMTSGSGGLRRQSGGVAVMAPSLKREAVQRLADNSKLRSEADAFLKALLRYYKVEVTAVYAKALLHCRARLFNRVGKLLLSPPASAHAAAAAYASIEARYADDLLGCNALSLRPAALHLEPEVVRTAGGEQEKKSKTSKRAAAPDDLEIFEEPGAASSTSLVAAPSGLGPAAGPGVAPGPADGIRLAYELPVDGMKSVPNTPADEYPQLLWRRLATQGLLHMHMNHKASADGAEVVVLEEAAPVVYQARALKAFAKGALVLVPLASADLLAFEDGAKLKRPRSLHPHLPFVCACRAGAFELDDSAVFLAKSPLASAAVPATVASPFWAVLQAKAPEHANMEVSTLTMESPSTSFVLEPSGKAAAKGRAKKPKNTPLTLVVPVFVNCRDVERGEVLVFKGDLSVVLSASEAPED